MFPVTPDLRRFLPSSAAPVRRRGYFFRGIVAGLVVVAITAPAPAAGDDAPAPMPLPVPLGPSAPAAYRTPPGVAYEPGVDVHGRTVPPASSADDEEGTGRGSPVEVRPRLRVPLAPPPAGPRPVRPELEIDGAVPVP